MSKFILLAAMCFISQLAKAEGNSAQIIRAECTVTGASAEYKCNGMTGQGQGASESVAKENAALNLRSKFSTHQSIGCRNHINCKILTSYTKQQ